MRTLLLKCVGLAACALVLIATAARAQNVNGSISGEVTDPTGAVVTGATVTAHNLDTGVITTAATNSSGVYHIEFLPAGRYQLTVEANGFNTSTLPPFSLEVLQNATLNVALKVGNAATTVNVSAAAPILETDSITQGSTFTSNTIKNIPINGLDFSALTLYMPGSVDTAGTSGMTSYERSTYYTDLPNVDGNRAQANNYTLDGIDINEDYNNLISYSPAPEALAEVRVQTADAGTEFGNVNGAGVVSVLKSGTNQFHGSAYGYVQDYRFDANSYQHGQALNSQGQLAPIPTSPYSFAQFGGTLGGPIKRNKLFFFVDYLGARQHVGGYGFASVIPDAMRNGNFSALLTGSNPIQLYDPENNFAPYNNDQGIPIVNPVAKFLFSNPKYYPDCGAASPVVPTGGKCLTPTDGIAEDNYEAPSRSYHANNQGDVKIEYDMNPRDKLTGFYAMSTAYDGQTAVLAITFPGLNYFPTWLMGANWVHTFSPSLVNSARIGFTRTKWSEGLPTDPTGYFGTSGNSKVGITFANQAYDGFTNQSLNANVSNVGTSAYNGNNLIDNTYSYLDDLTWQHGRHFISMGVEAIRYQNNYPTGNNDGYLGSLNYTGAFTADPDEPNAGGYGPADFVLDRVQSAGVTLGSINVGQRQWRTAGFAQDNFKLFPNLTLIFGLRYEYDEPWIEQNNKTGNVDLATGQILYAGHIPAGAPAGSGLCSNLACYQPNYRQWMPHVGFDYQATPRFVVRGGYGATSFFEGNSFNQRLTSITPFIQAVSVSVTSPTPGAVTTPRTAEEGFTGGTTQYGGTFNVYPQNIQPAYVQQWNLTTEYALTHTTTLQVGYVGEQGQHIEDYGNVNQYLVNGDQTSAPFYNNQYLGVNGVDASLGIGPNSLLITESRAMMNYNALQAVLRQRLEHGLEFTLNYTYGRAMTNSLGNYALNVNGYSGAFQNYYNSAADYGPAGYDVRHNISATGVYALPVGRGQMFLPNTNRVVDETLGGWKLSTATVYYSGFPESITGGSNNSNSYGDGRVNQYRTLKIRNRSNAHWFGTDPSATPCTTAGVDNGVCAFGVPAVNAFGTSSNGAVRGPGYFNVDLSAFKDFTTYHEQTIGFRFDAFNAFNIVSYGNPDTGITDSNFGNVSLQGPRSTERHLQFALHYNF
ncbi:MAG TPA: TonB-dependent receptor [Terracidiphilus sp.]|nr:TonB-dependent receptor [Terracidiphilus sp.]